MNLTTMVADPSVFDGLTPQQKSGLWSKLGAVQMVLTAGRGGKVKAAEIAAKERGKSVQVIHLWVKAYNTDGAAGLIDGRRKRGELRGTPEITKNWVKEEFLRMQREDAGMEIFKMIRERARLWKQTGNANRYRIPGYLDAPRIVKSYPEGLSYETIRRCLPSDYQKALARQDRKAASNHLPAIPMTRVGVEYLERVFFDDQMYDHYITEHGYEKPMRPVGFNALDFRTGAFLDFHIRLRWWDEADAVHKSLTQREFVWFVLGILSQVGYRNDERGTTLVFEHGTANSWRSDKLHTAAGHHSFDDALLAYLGGKVAVNRSGKFNEATFKELLFAPKSSGNFKYKAPLESMFKAVRTHGLLIPGPTGRNAEMSPGESYGLEREERKWLKLANSLPGHLSQAVRSNLLSFWEYYSTYRLVYQGINEDPEHALKDWEKCGYVKRLWRWEDQPGHWRSRDTLGDLPDHLLGTWQAEAARNPELVTTARMSRAEAMRVACEDPAITRLNIFQFHHFLPLEWALPVTVPKNRTIVLTDPLIRGSEPMTYWVEYQDERARRHYLEPGDKVLVHLDPFRPDHIIVLDQQGVQLGIIPRRPDDVPSNSEIAQDLLASRARMAAHLDAPVRAAMQPFARGRQEVRDSNEALDQRLKEDEAMDDLPDARPAPKRAAKPPRSRGGSGDEDPLSAPVSAAPEAPAAPFNDDNLFD